MRTRLDRHLLLLCLGTAFTSSALFAQVSQEWSGESSNVKYHSSVREVRLLFFANDDHNRPVKDLKEDDFAVIDDERVIRHFRSFSAADVAIHLDVVIVVDLSDSVLPQVERETAAVLQLISQWPWNADDNLSVVSLSKSQAHLICAESCHGSINADLLSSVPRGGATPLFDAVQLATTLLNQRDRPNAWRLIILLSDGQDTISRTSFREMSESVSASGAQVYAIDVNSPGQRSNGTSVLQNLSRESGGRYFTVAQGATKILTDILDDLHTGKVVTYALPASSADFHSIRILPTHNLNLQFRSRRGYYSSSSTEP